jgi:acetyl esterase/lipase
MIKLLRENKNAFGLSDSIDLAASMEVGDRSDPTPPDRLVKDFEVERRIVSNTVIFVVRAKERTAKRAVMFVHGGGYVNDFVEANWDVVATIAKRTDAEVWAVAYRLAPRQTAETTVREMTAVYKELISHWPPPSVAGIGDSAGGGLLLATVQAAIAEGAPPISLLVLVSPWVDLTMPDPDADGAEARDPMLDRGTLESAARAYAGDLPLDDPRVSPLFGSLSPLPSVRITAAGDDTLVYQGRRLRDALVASGVPTHYSEDPGMMHVHTFFPIPEGRRAFRGALGAIRRVPRP